MKQKFNPVTGNITTDLASKLLFQQARVHSVTTKKVPYIAK